MMAAPKMVLFDACFPTAALGLEACAKISIPKPFANPAGAWFPLSGPAAVDVSTPSDLASNILNVLGESKDL